jgi:DNA polymerase-2
MSWEGRYNIIVFLPSKAVPEVPALSHYWGIKADGEIKVRGIEVRRRNIPKIVKDAQFALIHTFRGVSSVKEFLQKIPEAKKKLLEYAEKIETGSLSRDDLSIRQKISRKPSRYKVNSYQAVASKQLEQSGVLVTPGMNVNFIILNAEAEGDFPEKKVILSDLFDPKKHQYDKKKYIEFLKRSFENMFPFKFTELDELLKSDSDRTRVQKDLLCFLK